MKLTTEELEKSKIKRHDQLYPPIAEIAESLQVNAQELFLVLYGGEGSEEVVQAVREWIA